MASIYEFNPFLRESFQTFIPGIETILEDAYVRASMFPNSQQYNFPGQHFGFQHRPRCSRGRNCCPKAQENSKPRDGAQNSKGDNDGKTSEDKKNFEDERTSREAGPSIEQILNNFVGPFLTGISSNFDTACRGEASKNGEKDDGKSTEEKKTEDEKPADDENKSKRSCAPMEHVFEAFIGPFLAELSSNFETRDGKNSTTAENVAESKDEASSDPKLNSSNSPNTSVNATEESNPPTSEEEKVSVTKNETAESINEPSTSENHASKSELSSQNSPTDNKSTEKSTNDSESPEQSPIFLISHEDNPCKIMVDVSRCDPKSIKVDFQENLVKVSGNTWSSDGFKWSVFENSVPSDVKPSDLTASVSASGILTVKESKFTEIPVIFESSKDESVESSTGAKSKIYPKLD